MSDAPTDIGLAEVLDAHKQQIVDLINTSQPGQIVAWDHAKQRASVQPLVKKMHVQEDETEVTEPQPVINNVIVWQYGSPRGRITAPIAVGDPCLVMHTNCSISNWSQSGGLVDPKDTRRHDISDAIALVGLHDFGHVPTDAPINALVMWVADGISILLGNGGANHPVPQGDSLQSALNTFLDALTVYVAGIKTLADPTDAFTATLKTAITVLQDASYLSSTVMVI